MTESISRLREKQIVEEMGSIFSIISNGMVIPLFLFFWIVDVIYIPELKWETLGLRLLVLPLVIFGRFVLSKPRSFTYLQVTMCIYACCCSAIINSIIFLMNQLGSSYYAGLNLIALGRPMPLARRLSSTSAPNQILLDAETAAVMLNSNFKVEPKSSVELKGFSNENVQVFELTHFIKRLAS